MKSRNFIICGLTGWCMEIFFTSMGSARKKDWHLKGQSSAWMFPIYGMASFFDIITPKIQHWSILRRGFLYGVLIMSGEYLSGSILNSFGVCPWNYKNAKYSIKGIVRMDYLPFWMIAGLFFEWILGKCNQASYHV
ncbi:MAG: hypothetical protein IKJ01_01700 [Lachnospiraceae bacterium]|nr:hypothetical protein [Lachnospiraceae bacterium]